MNFKKRVNGSWTDTPHYIHKTDTDILTTLPAVLYPTGSTATVGLKGNTLQSSIPSPTSPVMPQGTGDLETSGAKAGQYKIPISSAGQTTPVYLGEVESTRRIKKLVLDGTEDWRIYTYISNTYRLSISNAQSIGNPAICSHFVNSPIEKIISGKFTVGSMWIYICYEDVADLAGFKAYLATQYANGTPVTVWYVLAEPTTGIVNEPIRKIGNYADEVSEITIPTIAGANSFDVLTTLKPSEVNLAYTGWHDATVKEWDGSQWQ